MRLIWKEHDQYNPVLVVVGTLFIIGGGYPLLMISGPPIVWLVRGIPAILSAVGLVILIRQFQLRQRR